MSDASGDMKALTGLHNVKHTSYFKRGYARNDVEKLFSFLVKVTDF